MKNQTAGPTDIVQVDGASLIAYERIRQQAAEGYTAEHDDKYRRNELVNAAGAYAYSAIGNPTIGRESWCCTFGTGADSRYKPKTPIRDLVRAGALLAAEIDRRLRAGEKP